MSLRICLIAALPLWLFAQAPTTGPGGVPMVPGAPFSAIEIMETHQSATATDSKPTKMITSVARDSNGRTYLESHRPLGSSETGQGKITGITISDPIAHTRTELDPATMQASVSSIPASSPQPATQARYQTVDSEDLGVTSIEGLTVHGFRRSATIQLKPPTDQDGPIASGTSMSFTNEYWYSDQLQMNVKTKTEQVGGQTHLWTLTQMSLAEPDAALFQIPAGYSVTNVQRAVRISAGVAEANLINRVEPTYPEMAKSARVQGTVEFTATIGTDGVIKNLQLVRGHPLLVNPAKEAVLQWKYRPTLLNGEPVPVTAPVLVRFTLPEQN